MTKNDVSEGYLCIKEFSLSSGIPESTLKHYDDKGIFVPAARGEGPQNKYRYYAPIQLTTARMIRVMSEIGVPLKTISELVEDRTPEKMAKLFAKYGNIVANKLSDLNEVYAVIETTSKQLHNGIRAEEDEISVCEMPETPIIMGYPTDYSNGAGFTSELRSFCSSCRKPRLNTSFPVGAFYSDMDTFLRRPSEPTHFFSLDPNGLERKEQGLYLTGYTRGYYGHVNDLPQRMEAYAKKNGLVFDGPVYNTYLFDEISIPDPDHYLLQSAASVRETQRRMPR